MVYILLAQKYPFLGNMRAYFLPTLGPEMELGV